MTDENWFILDRAIYFGTIVEEQSNIFPFLAPIAGQSSTFSVRLSRNSPVRVFYHSDVCKPGASDASINSHRRPSSSDVHPVADADPLESDQLRKTVWSACSGSSGKRSQSQKSLECGGGSTSRSSAASSPNPNRNPSPNPPVLFDEKLRQLSGASAARKLSRKGLDVSQGMLEFFGLAAGNSGATTNGATASSSGSDDVTKNSLFGPQTKQHLSSTIEVDRLFEPGPEHTSLNPENGDQLDIGIVVDVDDTLKQQRQHVVAVNCSSVRQKRTRKPFEPGPDLENEPRGVAPQPAWWEAPNQNSNFASPSAAQGVGGREEETNSDDNGQQQQQTTTTTSMSMGGDTPMQSVLIRGALIVNDDSMFVADLLINDHIISQISPKIEAPKDAIIIDGTNKTLLPAGIDFFNDSTLFDSFNRIEMSSKAALTGGTTTIITIVHAASNETLLNAYDRIHKGTEAKARCNIAFSVLITAWNESVKEEVNVLVNDRGVSSFVIGIQADELLFEVLDYCRALRVHVRIIPQNKNIISLLEKRSSSLGKSNPECAGHAQLDLLEADMINRISVLSMLTSCPVSVVSLSSAEAAESVLRSRNKTVIPEVSVSVIAPDKSSSNKGMSKSVNPLFGCLFSIPLCVCVSGTYRSGNESQKISVSDQSIKNRLTLLWESCVLTGHIDVMRFVAISSSNAAKLCNIYPKKGRIAIGADADICLWDFSDLNDSANGETSRSPKLLMTICAGHIAFNGGEIHNSKPHFVNTLPRSPYLYSFIEQLEKVQCGVKGTIADKHAQMPEHKISKSHIVLPKSVPNYHYDSRISEVTEKADASNARSSTKVINPPGGRSTGFCFGHHLVSEASSLISEVRIGGKVENGCAEWNAFDEIVSMRMAESSQRARFASDQMIIFNSLPLSSPIIFSFRISNILIRLGIIKRRMPLGLFGIGTANVKSQQLESSSRNQFGVFDGKDWRGSVVKLPSHTVTLEKRLAEGGFAIVYLSIDKQGNRYALKRQFISDDTRQLEACRRECRIVSCLGGHKNIISYVDHLILKNSCGVYECSLLTAYYKNSVLQLMNDRHLAGRCLSAKEILKIFCDVCEAVARLHHSQTPVIHRDLKVENVLIDDRGKDSPTYVLCDFGSATTRVLSSDTHSVQLIEEEIHRYTTLSYRAPEMIDVYSGRPIGTKIDTWALGVTLYRLCYFILPFGESSLAIQNCTYCFPSEPQYPDELRAIIKTLLNPDLAQRPDIYQTSNLAFETAGQHCPVGNLNKVPALHIVDAVKNLLQVDQTNPNTKHQITSDNSKKSVVQKVSFNDEVSTSINPRLRPRPVNKIDCAQIQLEVSEYKKDNNTSSTDSTEPALYPQKSTLSEEDGSRSFSDRGMSKSVVNNDSLKSSAFKPYSASGDWEHGQKESAKAHDLQLVDDDIPTIFDAPDNSKYMWNPFMTAPYNPDNSSMSTSQGECNNFKLPMNKSPLYTRQEFSTDIDENDPFKAAPFSCRSRSVDKAVLTNSDDDLMEGRYHLHSSYYQFNSDDR